MTLWLVFALMTAVAIFAVLWPLGQSAGMRNDASEATVYKDQLSEIDRDLTAGLIASPEADAARVEISRRLLSAADHQRAPPTTSSIRMRRIAATVALVGLPALSVALYLPLGSPSLRAPERLAPANPSTTWLRRLRRIWRKIRPMAAAGMCWRRC